MKNLKRMESAFMSEFEKVTTGLGEECGVFGAYDAGLPEAGTGKDEIEGVSNEFGQLPE